MTQPRTWSSRPGPRTNFQGQGQDQGLQFCP